MKNEIVLSFCIWDFNDISHDEITKVIGVKPSKIYVKGQKRNPDLPGLAKGNGWILESFFNKYAPFDDQMNYLLDILEPKILELKPICEKYYCEFSCGLFIYFDNGESIPSVHLNTRYNSIAHKLNLEFDLDIYCLPNEN